MRLRIVLLACCAALLAPAGAAAYEDLRLERSYPAAFPLPELPTVELFRSSVPELGVWLAVDGGGQAWWANGSGPAVTSVPVGAEPPTVLQARAPLTALVAGTAGQVFAAAGEPARIVRAGADAPTWTITAGTGEGRVTDLAVGPDGTVWYTAVTPSRIGRVGADGTGAQEWPTQLAAPNAIAVGADGEVWVGGRTKVARFDPATGKAMPRELAYEELVADLAISSAGDVWSASPKGYSKSGSLASIPPTGDALQLLLSGRNDPRTIGFADGEVWVGSLGDDADDGLLRVRDVSSTFFAHEGDGQIVAVATASDRVLTMTRRPGDVPDERVYVLGTLVPADVADLGSYPADQALETRVPRWARKPFSFADRGFRVPIEITLARPGSATVEVRFDTPPGEHFIAMKFPRTREVADPSQPITMDAFLNPGHTRRLREALRKHGELTARVKVIARSDDQRVVQKLRLVVRR